jgi:mRNA interferase HicA
MKYSAFHRFIRRSSSGWQFVGATGSHYIYEKDGRRYPVPYHGSKEIGEGLRKEDYEGYGVN